jgi:hypothetical protein
LTPNPETAIKDDKVSMKEKVKTIKEKLIQRINQMEKELTNKLDTLVQENTKFQQDEISRVLDVTEEVELYLNLLVSSFSTWLILWMSFSLSFFMFSFILCLSSLILLTFSSLYFNILFTISTFKLQNRIEDTGSVITSMVVTDDDHLLLCDYNSGRLVAAYYPSGKHMKIIGVSYTPWDIAIIPRTHRAVVTFANKKIQFINLQTFTQDDRLITIQN